MAEAAQQAVQVLLDLLQGAAGWRVDPVDALEAHRQAGIHQLEQVLVALGRALGLLELAKEAAAGIDILVEHGGQALRGPAALRAPGRVQHDVVEQRADRIAAARDLVRRQPRRRPRYGQSAPPRRAPWRRGGRCRAAPPGCAGAAPAPAGLRLLEQGAARSHAGPCDGRLARRRPRCGWRRRHATRPRPDDRRALVRVVEAEGIVGAHRHQSRIAQHSICRSGKSPATRIAMPREVGSLDQ